MTFVLAVLDAGKQRNHAGQRRTHAAAAAARRRASSNRSATTKPGLPLGVDADYRIRAVHAHARARRLSHDVHRRHQRSDERRRRALRPGAAARAVVDRPDARSRGLGRLILDDVKRFVGGRAQSDDMCLACFGRGQE